MSRMLIIAIIFAAVILAGLGVSGVWFMRRIRRSKQLARFKVRWLAVQHQCAQSTHWPNVVVEADTLLDDVLKTLGYKGRGMGERLVSAQRKLTDNDGVWFGHKLRNKISQEEITRLYKKDVQAALRGMRQALQDLGVL